MPSKRPHRMQIRNELGLLQTLPAGTSQFTTIAASGKSPLLLLGLGPEPDVAKEFAKNVEQVLWLEAPSFSAAMPASWREAIPGAWQRLNPEASPEASLDALLDLLIPALHKGHVLLYRPGPRLFPAFWGPILGALRWQMLRRPAPTAPQKHILLPCDNQALLVPELAQGFEACGRKVQLLRNLAGDSELLARELADCAPALFCSVNFRALDAYGEHYHLLRAAGSEVAVWCVDNPWHLLSGLKSPYWRELQLFVTDASFIPGLQSAGARHVTHLPLAAWPEGFAPPTKGLKHDLPSDLETSFSFVGRSSFPDKNSFFAGLRLPEALWREAIALFETGQRADFQWWQKQLQLERLWPGRDSRLAGLGAEETGLRLRLRCLQHVSQLAPLHVFGDEAWPTLLSPAAKNMRFHPPIDYYGALPALYASARYTLNATSPLLPAGLTQRHFDVWTAGGFLLSDATPGLNIFPDELTAPIVVDATWSLKGLENRLKYLEREPGLRKDIQSAWRHELQRAHTIRHRAMTILEECRLH